MRARRVGRGAAGRAGIVAAVVALALSGCASLGGGTTDPGAGGEEDDVTEPLLQVRLAGGFVPMGWDFRTVPQLTVYEDGLVVSQGPQIMIYPAPALPNLLTSQLTADEVDAIVTAARDAGLLEDGVEYGQPPVADVPTTFLTLTVDGETFVHEAFALGFGDGTGPDGEVVDASSSSLSDENLQARAALAGFLAEVNDLAGAGDGEPYDITAFAVMAVPAQDEGGDVAGAAPADGDLERQLVPWPVDVALADADRCAVVEGDDAATLKDTLAEANDLTRYEQDGVTYDVFVRPLLPHEDGCDGLV